MGLIGITVADLMYKDECIGYRLFLKENVSDEDDVVSVYDVRKDLGVEFNLDKLSDRVILLIPDGKLLISKDEIDNNYVVDDLSEDRDKLEELLSSDCIDNILNDDDTDDDTDTDDSDGDFVDEIDSLYDEDDDDEDSEESTENNDSDDTDDFVDEIDEMYSDDDLEEEVSILVDGLCDIYLKPSRLSVFKDCEGVPVNLNIEVSNALRKNEIEAGVEEVSLAIISKMYKNGYVYKSSDDFCNGMTEGTFLKRV